MSDWTAGYVADIGYTYGYYTELNPLRIKLAFINAGLVCPEIGTACELGFGQGLSANIHAAASVSQWYGTDFNPSQAGFAQELAAASGSNIQLFDQAFAEFAARPDLPEFDFIGIHGIWSWISDENRSVIVNFIRGKLKVGGVLFISYNTLPGWAAFAPMRHLMTVHADTIGADGHGIVSRINGAIEFTDKLLDTNPSYARVNPQIADRINKIKGHERQYLAHEYFNRDWHPMHFATIADWLKSAKLQFACSAYYLDHIETLNLTQDQLAFLKDIPDLMFRESTRDFMVNQQFRKDYWIKGARKLSLLEQAEMLRSQRVMLSTPGSGVTLKVTGSLGEASMSEDVYNPILDLLMDHKPKTLGQMEQALKAKNITFYQVVQAALLLTGAGHLSAVQDDTVTAKSKQQTDKLNSYLMQKARSSSELSYLASPVTGGGINIGRFQQLFLLAMIQGKKQPVEWAEFVWQILELQGQKIVKDGKMLETAEENIAELSVQAQDFSLKRLPVLKALQII